MKRQPSITAQLANHTERLSFAADVLYAVAAQIHPHAPDGSACPMPLAEVCRGHQALTVSKVRIQTEAQQAVDVYRSGGRRGR